MRPLFAFIDESGNFDFSEKGTEHFVMAAVMTLNPLESSGSILALKYELLQRGLNVSHFHASTDRQAIRDKVIAIAQLLRNIEVHTVALKKSGVASNARNPSAVNLRAGSVLGDRIGNLSFTLKSTSVVMVFDKALTHNQQQAFLRGVKRRLSHLRIPVFVLFHQLKFDPNGQIADYFAWARYVSLERKEMRPIDALAGKEKSLTLL